MQRHELAAEAVAGCEFAGQATQAPAAVAPDAAEYVPATQLRQVADTDAPVAVEYLPASQSTHVAFAVAPVAVEYFPALQSVHAGTCRCSTGSCQILAGPAVGVCESVSGGLVLSGATRRVRPTVRSRKPKIADATIVDSGSITHNLRWTEPGRPLYNFV